MINDAKKALAGLEVMMAIIEIVNARRPDIVEQSAEKVLGVKTDLGDEEFKAILDKRAEAITHFDKYPDRIAELEEALVAVRSAAYEPIESPCEGSVRLDIALLCDEALMYKCHPDGAYAVKKAQEILTHG